MVVAQGLTKHTRLFSWSVVVPNNPALIGAHFPFQGLGLDNAGRLAWTNASMFAIQ